LTHPPVTNKEDLVRHMREMIEQGYSNQQIIELHPELATLFGENNDPEGTDS